jgi:hypothetical protein
VLKKYKTKENAMAAFYGTTVDGKDEPAETTRTRGTWDFKDAMMLLEAVVIIVHALIIVFLVWKYM